MGNIKHHAIVVTSDSKEKANMAHKKAKELFKETVSELISSEYNGYYSFFIAPDGSKEGWPESEKADLRRKQFNDWVNLQAYEDGSNQIRFCEMFYGEMNGLSKIENHN